MFFRKPNGWSVLIIVLASALAARAADITGAWAIQDLQVANKLQLSFNVNRDGGGRFSSSSAFDIAQLRGLTQAQIATPTGTMVRFDLVREAGTFACEGYFKDGNGAGTFVFRPDPGFILQMRSLGFLDVNEDRLFSLAVHDIGPRFVAELRATGIALSSTDQLVAMHIHGVTPDFIRRMQQAGFRPGEEDLVKMRIHGVTPDFADEVRRMYASASIEDLVRMRIHGVSPDFASDVRRLYANASLEDLVRLRIHGVTMDYIRRMQSRGNGITLEQILSLRIHGID